MGIFVVDFFEKVFQEEKATVVAWLRRHKGVALVLVGLFVIIVAYFRNPGLLHAIAIAVVSTPTPLWVSLVLLLWLVGLTVHAYNAHKTTDQREFIEDFRHGLENWQYYGGWRTERENSQRILIVTDSDAGGIAKPCRLWTDYDFEFETKIVQANTSWIIRAYDSLNYVMLQCGQSVLNPHFREKGFWFKLDPVGLPLTLPLNAWFGVRIRVTGTRVVVNVKVEDKEKEVEILNCPLLEPKLVSVQIVTPEDTTQRVYMTFSYPLGSVGFREWGNTECAHFRNVRVRRI